MKRGILTWIAVAVTVSASARAALTDAEKAQVRSLVRAGDAARAAHVRSLVGRPDLSTDEAAESLVTGFERVPFDEKHERFAKALLFGPGSAAARNALVVPVVRGLLARAAVRMGDIPVGGTESWREAVAEAGAEVIRIHRFVAGEVANAGRPPPGGHDPSLAIRDDALSEAAKEYAAHIEAHGRWLRHGNVARGLLLRVRAQAQVTAADLARGVVPRHEVSGWLGLEGARKRLFERHGVLLEDGDLASAARLEAAARFLQAVPRSLEGARLWVVSKVPVSGLATLGEVMRARTPLDASSPRLDVARIWPEEVRAPAPDAQLAEVAYSASWRAVRTAFRVRPETRRWAQEAVKRAEREGVGGYLASGLVAGALAPAAPDGRASRIAGASPELMLAHCVQLLSIDTPRALQLALLRLAVGRRAPMEQFALALGVLTLVGPDLVSATVGSTLEGGNVDRISVPVKTRSGRVTGFELGGHSFEVEWSDGAVVAASMDGAKPRVADLPSVRLRAESGDRWSFDGVELGRLSGQPRAVVIDGRRLRVTASEPGGGFDSMVAGRPATDMQITARVLPRRSGGGLLVRASAGEVTYQGAAVLLSAVRSTAQLVLVDGRGKAFEMTEARKLPPASGAGYRVTLSIRGSKVRATVDAVVLEGELPRELPPGRVGVAVRRGGEIELTDLSIGAPGAKRKGR